MSGEQELAIKQDNQVEKWDKILDEYEKGTGLPPFLAPGEETELQGYLSMNRDHMEKLDEEDCKIIAFRLGQFSFHLQRAQNREIARLNWAKSTIKTNLAHAVTNYKAYSYEERLYQATKDDDAAKKLNQVAIYAQQRSDRLNFLAKSMQNLSDIMKSIYYSKRHDNG